MIEQQYLYDFAASDPDANRVSYALLEGPAGMALDAPARRLSWFPLEEDHGTQTVRLAASDDRGGEAIQEWTITVRYPALDAAIALAGAAAGPSPHTAQFTARPSTRFVNNYHWDFGDGATEAGPDARIASHTWADYAPADFPANKPYTVTLTLTGPGDGAPQVATATQAISLAPPRPVADFTADTWVQVKPEGTPQGTLFDFEFTQTSRWASDFSWSFPDATPAVASGEVVAADFPSDSVFRDAYEVTLTATGPSGVSTVTKQVVLQPADGTEYTVLDHPDPSNAWPGWRKAVAGDIDLPLAADFDMAVDNGDLVVAAASEGHALAVSPTYQLNNGPWEFEFEAEPGQAGGATGPEGLTIMLPGNVPLVLVRIPAGSFVMGSPADERSHRSNEGPQTNVRFTQDFYMGKYEVTQAQWIAVMESWPGPAPSPASGLGPNHPAYSISWALPAYTA